MPAELLGVLDVLGSRDYNQLMRKLKLTRDLLADGVIKLSMGKKKHVLVKSL